MSYNMTIRSGVVSGGEDIRSDFIATGEGRISISETLEGESSYSVDFLVGSASVQALFLVADAAVDVQPKDADGETAGGSISLAAGVPVIYCADPEFGENPLDGAVAELEITNGEAFDASVRVECLYDPTPA